MARARVAARCEVVVGLWITSLLRARVDAFVFALLGFSATAEVLLMRVERVLVTMICAATVALRARVLEIVFSLVAITATTETRVRLTERVFSPLAMTLTALDTDLIMLLTPLVVKVSVTDDARE